MTTSPRDRLAALFGLAHDTGDVIAFEDRLGEPGVQAQVDIVLGYEIFGSSFPSFGIEGDRVAHRRWLGSGVVIVEPPARPLAEHRVVRPAIFFRRVDRELHILHALDDLLRDAFDGDLVPIAHVVQHQDHRPRCQTAELGVALDESDLGTVSGGRHRRREPCRPAAHDNDVGFMNDVTHGFILSQETILLHDAPTTRSAP